MRLATSLFFALFIYVLLLVITVEGQIDVDKKVPAIYVFGDSTADVGNNKNLPAINNPADFLPYGIDYPTKKPTGRFSNGYNVIDYLAKHMGFMESPPPYLPPRNKTWETGVSFASAGSGILNSTGPGTLSMAKQIEYFAKVRQDIVNKFGQEQATLLFSKSIFLISSGGNDFFALFSSNINLKFYYDFISNYDKHIKELYNLGARKFAIIDVPPVGCIPGARYVNLKNLTHTDGCLKILNSLVGLVNSGVRSLLKDLKSSELRGMEYSIGSSYDLVLDIVDHPHHYGFKAVKKACCGSGRLNVEMGCDETSPYCSDRDNFLFWDAVHPTMKTAQVAATAFFSNSLQFATPISFKTLVDIGN
ncbi:GDSL esterase/lipase At2g04570-like [Typha latifolia]|uniref:GDSL esterase/lipase At2g04570-like n=1 Tax=Typha latifolia TaxID=4733 RepID=UPI003C2ED72C